MLLLLLQALGRSDSSSPSPTVSVWQPVEFNFTSSKAYKQPLSWWGLEFNVTLKHAQSATQCDPSPTPSPVSSFAKALW